MRGYTLVELLFVLTLLGATTASLAPTARRYRDRGAVVAAREALVGLLAEARVAAMETGEARVALETTPGIASAAAADSTLRVVDFGAQYQVALSLSGGRSEVELTFDALGLGRMSAQTVGFRRGDAFAELVVSGYGRVRRR